MIPWEDVPNDSRPLTAWDGWVFVLVLAVLAWWGGR